MNAERLHAISRQISNEINGSRICEKFQEMLSALQGQIGQPGSPQFQNLVASRRSEIQQLLRRASSNQFSPSWKQIVYELGGQGLIGMELEERLQGIFERNQITLPTAIQELAQIQQALNAFRAGMTETATGMDKLGIGAEDLLPGESEVGVTIPRRVFDNDLAELPKELGELRFILMTFMELTTGKSGPLPINTISSSDLSVFVHIAPPVAAAIAVAAERIINAYKQVLEIRIKRAELQKLGVPAEKLTALEEHANSAVGEAAEQLAIEFEEKHLAGC